jgi:hypothetical protein
MFSELTVTIKDDEKRLSKKYTVYEPFMVSHEDKTIKECVEDTLANFDSTPDHIEVKITLDMQ